MKNLLGSLSLFCIAGTSSLCVTLLGCDKSVDDESGDSANAGSADAGTEGGAIETSGAGASSGTATPPEATPCWERTTEAECLADDNASGCGWEALYRVVEDVTCALEVDGGTCLGPVVDDGCEGLLGRTCSGSLVAGYLVDEDGTVRVGVGNEVCYTGVLTGCPEDPSGSDAPAECACACSAGQP